LPTELHGPGCNGYWDPTDLFFKRVNPCDWNWEENRPNSSAFTNYKMSANWSALSSVQHTIEGYPGYGVVSLTEEVCRKFKQVIEYSPVRDHPSLPDNPAHCDVVGEKRQRTLRRRLAAASVLCEAPVRPGEAG
jgi:hypothetical protein